MTRVCREMIYTRRSTRPQLTAERRTRTCGATHRVRRAHTGSHCTASPVCTHTCAQAQAHLVVEGTDVQGCVPRGVLSPHVGSVEQQVLQVLHVPEAAGLGRKEVLLGPWTEPKPQTPETKPGTPPPSCSPPTWWTSCQPFSSAVPSRAWSCRSSSQQRASPPPRALWYKGVRPRLSL